MLAVRDVDLDLRAGEVVALMGRNGSGKSSLLWALQGSGPRHAGTVASGGVDPRALPAARGRAGTSAWCRRPRATCSTSTPSPAECAQADRGVGGRRRHLPRRCSTGWCPGIPGDRHPRDLSEGQRLALVLAVQLAAAPPVVLLDEPTRGLDYPGKRHLARGAARAGRRRAGRWCWPPTTSSSSAAAADRVVVLADGEVVADGPTADVVVASPAFAPQVAKVLAPRAVADRRPRWPPRWTRMPGDERGDRGGRATVRGSGPCRCRALGWCSCWRRSAGLAVFVWPLLISPRPAAAGHTTDAPLIFVLTLPVLVLVVLAELSSGGIDAKALALLGVLSAVNAALRPLGAGTAGIETVFFLLVLAGRVFGPGFGFVLGSTSLFASALLTAGVGPWLPFQMLAAVLGRARRRPAPPGARPGRDRPAGGVRRARRATRTAC